MNETIRFLEHLGLQKTFQNTPKSKVKNKRFASAHKDQTKVLQQGGGASGSQMRDSSPQSAGRAGTPYTRF